MSTPTPITDYASERTDAFDSPAKAREFARRLELDRSALMEALESSERISRAIKRGEPMIEARFNAMVDEFEAERESALSTARANFPES